MDNAIYKKCWALFEGLGIEALSLSHYALVDSTHFGTPQLWKEFLMSREVSDYIKSEQSLIQSAELNKLIRGIGTSHSVGQAQVLSTLAKLAEQKPMKEGPAFVYCYIPLSPEQIQAPAVRVLDKDPFIKERR